MSCIYFQRSEGFWDCRYFILRNCSLLFDFNGFVFSVSGPMYVVLAFTPIVVQDGKRFLEGTSASSVSICSTMWLTQEVFVFKVGGWTFYDTRWYLTLAWLQSQGSLIGQSLYTEVFQKCTVVYATPLSEIIFSHQRSVGTHVAMVSAQGPTCAPALVVIFPQAVERPQVSSIISRDLCDLFDSRFTLVVFF